MGRFDDRARNGDRGFGDLLVWQLGLKEGDDHAARPAWTNIPVAEDPTAALRQANGRPQVSWFGHASAHIRLGGASFLVDPVEGDAFMVPRKTQPVPISRIVPKPSAVLVTHNHYDHMDEKSLLQYPKTTPIVAPLGLGDWFVRRGFTNVSEFDWWQSTVIDDVRVTFVPSQHWSRRGLFDQNNSLWGGYVFEGSGYTVHHAGDSGYTDDFGEIGRRFPNVDLAFIPIGAYAPRWFMKPAHMNPVEAIKTARDVGAGALVPIHYGTFILTDEPLGEPPALLEMHAEDEGFKDVHFLPVGGSMYLDGDRETV